MQNVTDVDDPLLERASATGVDWRSLAEQQIQPTGRHGSPQRVAPEHLVGAVEAIPGWSS